MKLFNEYQTGAIYVPTFLVFLPLLTYVLLNFNLNDSLGIIMIRLSFLTIFFYLVGEYGVRNLGRILEFKIFKDKTIFPTIKVLKLNSTILNSDELDEITKKIKKDFNIKLNDINNDDSKILFLNKKILNKVQNGRLVLDKNITYGACRNFLGGSILGVIISFILFCIYLGTLHSFIYLGFICVFALVFLLRYELLNFYGNIYAKTLFEEYLII